MMKRLLYILVLLLLVSQVHGLSDEILSAKELDIGLETSERIEIQLEPTGYIDYVEANLTLVPVNNPQQEILSKRSEPQPVLTGDTWQLFRWEQPAGRQIEFSTQSDIRTRELYPIIKDERFPIIFIPEEMFVYTESTSGINSDAKGIRPLASSLVEGHSELYPAVHAVAEWVESNINYTLDEATKESTMSATWVLENRKGACDEITTLFIALLRSVGIPARYVSGMAYTNLNEMNNFGMHGWGEVYFPSAGWIPFDVTYSEFGFVDPTHIVLKYSMDTDEPAATYRWTGREASLKTGNRSITPVVKNFVKSDSRLVSVQLEPFREAVGFGSYNLIDASVTNLMNGYLSQEITLSRVISTELLTPQTQRILLKPRETRHVYWLIRIPDNLDSSYIYTFPFTLSTHNLKVTTEFRSAYGSPVYDKELFQPFFEQREARVYTASVELECIPDKREFYIYETASLTCSVRNTGNKRIRNAELCFLDECTSIELTINEEKILSFDLPNKKIGEQAGWVRFEHMDVSSKTLVEFAVLDVPDMEFSQLQDSYTVRYGDTAEVSFMLNKTSFSEPVNLVVSALGQVVIKRESLSESERHILKIDSRMLRPGPNDIRITANYTDKNSRRYSGAAEITVNVINVPLLERVFFKLEEIVAGIMGVLGG